MEESISSWNSKARSFASPKKSPAHPIDNPLPVFGGSFAQISLGLECYLRQSHVRTIYDTETATPSYTLLSLSAGTDLRRHGRRVASLFVTVTNLTDRSYQSHLSRLKYADGPGICNMGRSVGFKLLVPISL